MGNALKTIDVARLVVSHLILDKDVLKAACTPELYATEEAYRLVKEKDVPFRDAYHEVSKKY
jgi:argininosuccinate lyase